MGLRLNMTEPGFSLMEKGHFKQFGAICKSYVPDIHLTISGTVICWYATMLQLTWRKWKTSLKLTEMTFPQLQECRLSPLISLIGMINTRTIKRLSLEILYKKVSNVL